MNQAQSTSRLHRQGPVRPPQKGALALTRLVAVSVLLLTLLAASHAAAEEVAEWEYLVVSYGTTYFTNPLLDLEPHNAARSKVMLFSDLGLTLPSEAFSLQSNMDVLGRFGWELVGLVGSIGGDQQLVFKRLFDAERSSTEAERIREQREALIAEFVSAQSANEADAPNRLLDLDRVERAQATEARNLRDAGIVVAIVDAAMSASPLLTLVAREAVGSAYDPSSSPRVSVSVTIDVTDVALVGQNQYRMSHVMREIDRLRDALLASGLREQRLGTCRDETSAVDITVVAVIQHDGSATDVARRPLAGTNRLCLQNP